MSQYTSYFLYQKYVKYGDQGWLPVYPNVYSADGDGTMSVSAKTENDPACGYVPSGTDDYNYSKWESASSYICEDTTKYARERLYVSDDNINWTPTDIYKRSTTVLEYDSTDCGYDQQWDNYNCIKWEDSGTICNEGNKYERLRKYFRQCVDCEDCSTEWFASNIYKQGEIIEYNSTDCGFVHGEKEYRWVNLDINYDWICDDCPSDPTITINRWINLDPSVDYYCSGTTKYYKQEKQTSNDRGVTWEDTGIYRSGDVAESYSIDCDVVVHKFSCNYLNDTAFVLDCNSSTTLTSGEIKPAGYTASAMTNAEIGSCVTTMGYGVFSGCTSLSSVTIPDNVTSIGDRAFERCTSLTSITIPSGVTSINYSVFQNCSGLTSIDIPDSVTSIAGSAFYGCSGLTSIDIPNGVTSIGNYAFYNCSGLQSMTVNAVTPPTLGYNAFNNTNNFTIYVPAGSIDTYKAASGWSDYTSRIQGIP